MDIGGATRTPLIVSASNSILNAQGRVSLAGEQLVDVATPPTARQSVSGLTRGAGVTFPDRFNTPYSADLARVAINLSHATIGYSAAATLVKVWEAMEGEVLDLVG